MGFTEVAGTNANLNTRAVIFATSTAVELVGRPYLNVFHQDRLIPPDIDFHMIPVADSFVCKSAAPATRALHQNYKIVIQQVNLIIHTKQRTSTAQKAHKELSVVQNMRTHYSRIQIKHLSIFANYTLINFDICTSAPTYLVIIGLVSDAGHTGCYQNNSFNFQTFGVNSIDFKRNGMPVHDTIIFRISLTGSI